MGKSRSKDDLLRENRYLRRNHISQNIVILISNLAKWATLALIAYFGYLSIAVLAGKTTASNIAISFFSDLKINKDLALIFGGSGLAYGGYQRQLRKKTIERLQGRIQTLEKCLDQRRSSSKLTTRGSTRPEDKI